MANCKDCLGFEFCLDRLGTTKYYDNAIAANNVEELCQKFKDRNRFVELPCKVGDTVYLIKNHNIYERKVTRIIFDPRTIIQLMAKDYVCYASCIGRNDFGKTVFLTREEAEQALKESKNDE